MSWGSVVEYLPGMYEALGLILSAEKTFYLVFLAFCPPPRRKYKFPQLVFQMWLEMQEQQCQTVKSFLVWLFRVKKKKNHSQAWPFLCTFLSHVLPLIKKTGQTNLLILQIRKIRFIQQSGYLQRLDLDIFSTSFQAFFISERKL